MSVHPGGIFARIEAALERRDRENRASAARLTEYTKFKDEIANRSTLQNAIMTVNIAASAHWVSSSSTGG